MIEGAPRAQRVALRLAALVAAPLAVWLGAAIAAPLLVGPSGGVGAQTELRDEGVRVRSVFERLLTETDRISSIAISESPTDAYRYAVRGVWGDRIEGVGIVDATGEVEDWEGAPSRTHGNGLGAESWRVSTEGLRVRLVTSTNPDDRGRFAVASFILDSPLGDFSAHELLTGAVSRGYALDLELIDSRESTEDVAELFDDENGVYRGTDAPTLYLALRSPAGEVLALAKLQALPSAPRVQGVRAAGAGLAAVVFAILLGVLFDWAALCRSPRGLAIAVLAVCAGRVALLWSRAPAHLLPRQLGSPSLYGSARSFGLLGSPVDLLLSAIALLLLSYALGVLARNLAPRRRAVAVVISSVAFLTLTAVSAALSVSVARHSGLAEELFEAMSQPLGQLTLLTGLGLTIIAAAESGALALVLVGRKASGAPSRLTVGLVLLPLAALASSLLLLTLDRIDIERMRSELAPQVLEQSSRREIALRAAVSAAAGSEAARDAVLAPPGDGDDYVAYDLWVAGELFYLGFKSSLDLYDATGAPVSHFGFDLPPLNESVVPPASTVGPREELVSPALAVAKRLVHLEAPILIDGIAVGTVVGHVLDEPENLSFLPSHEPYLAALGPGRNPRPRPIRSPAYVLYGDDGRVLLSTVRQPPAAAPSLRQAAVAGSMVRVTADGAGHAGVPLVDGERLHLLLMPARPLLDRLAVFAKLLLFSVGLLTVMTIVRTLARDGGPGGLVRAVRESFYNKLLATLLLASLLPLIGLALFLGGYFEHRVSERLAAGAAQVVRVVKHVVEDYAAVQSDDSAAGPQFDDEILYWLRAVVEQEIHLYEDGELSASSMRELFSSGLLSRRLPGEVHRRILDEGLPYVVVASRMGPSSIPVAYGRIDLPGEERGIIAAIPLILEQQEIERDAERVEEMLVLTTVLLAVLVIVATSLIAGTVARPVRELVGATGRIAAGDYSARLTPRSSDEVARLVQEFNSMAEALSQQRDDLVRRRDYMEALLTNATTGVLSTDASGSIVTLNPAAEKLLGLGGPPPAVGDDLVESVAGNPRLAPLARALRLPDVSGEPTEVDLELDGEPLRLRSVRIALPDPRGAEPGALILLDDVTDLMRSNQLAAWAEMARAIAHEIKNPLTPIQLSTEHLERLLRDRNILPSPDLDACLGNVMKQVQALRQIASEFSAYAKLPSLAPEPTEPAALMRDVMKPYRAAPPREIAIEERYDEAPTILVDRRVLCRAVVNLVENALHAMKDGGTLTVSTSTDGNEALLSVEDTGPGLDPDVRARLFEPYFSTKSSGTGLGLAIVRQAVEAHGGRIEVDSHRGHGTVFRFRIPRAPAEPTLYSSGEHGEESSS